jgi:flagellin-like hook-associated protein FlgL
MTQTQNNDCPDITPINNCNDTCCPDYEPTEDWCKSFNKRTLEQQRKSQQSAINGMWLNLSDTRNTIGQAEQYIAVIYELLLAILDQIVKVSSVGGATEGDYESTNAQIHEYLSEIEKIANGAQYNGNRLLSGSITITDGTVAHKNSPTLKFPFMGCIGFCRTVDSSTNDFNYVPPCVGTAQLFGTEDPATPGTYSLADSDADLPIIDGSDESVDTIDPAIQKVNCGIKKVGVQLDKLRAYRQVLCLREKQIKICKNGQDICFEHKCKL